MDEPVLLLPQKAAAYLGISELAVHRLIAAGKIRTVFFRGVVRLPVYELDKYRESEPAD